MYIGPITVDESQIADVVSQIPVDACVLELGAGNGTYSVALKRRVKNYLGVEPDGRLVRCIIANAENHRLQLGVINAMISPVSNLCMVNRILTEDLLFIDDTIRTAPLEEIFACATFEFNYIVVHESTFLDHFTKYYPEFVSKCTLLKTYTI